MAEETTSDHSALLEASKALDKDGTGITPAELRKLLDDVGGLDASEIDQIMQQVGADSDGKISYESFVDMLVTGYPIAGS